MNKTDVVRARIETRLKKHAESIFRRLGVSHSTFINMSYRAVVEEGGIPLSLHVPNATTARVLREAGIPAKRAKYTRAASLEEFAASLKARPER